MLSGRAAHQEVRLGDDAEVFNPEIQALVNLTLVPAGAELFFASIGYENYRRQRWREQFVEQINDVLNRARRRSRNAVAIL